MNQPSTNHHTAPGALISRTGVSRPLALSVLVLALLLAGMAVASPARATVDPFYQRLLQNGSDAYHRGDTSAAQRLLRLACFGMLEEPPLLTECLIRLGLAQADANDQEAFRATARRLLEVEQRFRVYTRVQLPRDLLNRFEGTLVQLMPSYTLQAVPTFRPLLPASLDDGEAPAPDTDSPTADGAERAADDDDVEPANAVPRATPLSPADREQLRRAREEMRLASRGEELERPFELAQDVASRHPESTEAQHLAAEIAYRASHWQVSAEYFQRGGVPSDAQPVLQFFMAVALYESGDTEYAATVMRRCLPNLQRTDFVSRYETKILAAP